MPIHRLQLREYAKYMHKICIYICIKYACIWYAYNMYKYASNMHQICIKYTENMPLHRLQHSKYADYMQKNMQKICSICNKNMQKYMQLIFRICISLCISIFCIYMHSPLCWCTKAPGVISYICAYVICYITCVEYCVRCCMVCCLVHSMLHKLVYLVMLRVAVALLPSIK